MYSWQFSKKFSPPQKWRPFWIFEFLPKIQKHKIACISLTVWDRAISSKFLTHGVSRNVLLPIFKHVPLPKNGGHFEFLPKMAKHKIACISLTVQGRAILSKFSTHRVSKESTNVNFQKIFPSPKMADILNFPIFAKNGKTQNCLYLLNCAR